MGNSKRRLSVASQSDDREDIVLSSKRRPTVYDAVAGRVTRDALKHQTPPKTHAKSYKGQPLRPDEILYRARNAPNRYEETDHYFAHWRLPPDQKLPSGDLLSALHAYVSQFFARNEDAVNQKVWRCMDETALIALGILVEESAREILGETGDLAFTEGVEVEEECSAESKGEPQGEEIREGSRAMFDGVKDGTADENEEESDDEYMDNGPQEGHDGSDELG